MQATPPSPLIGVLDSGIGGLSVLKSILQDMPQLSFAYLADHYAYPYGEKTEAELVDRLCQLVPRFLDHYPVKLLVLACNTASTVALNALRARVPIPLVGVIPAIKPAALASQSKVIAVLATPGTIKREYTERLIKSYALACKVLLVGSSKLVDLAEKKIRGEKLSLDEIHSEIEPLLAEPQLDTVVLACTHFPFLAEELATLLPRKVSLMDSGHAIARRVASLLAESSQPPEADTFKPARVGNTLILTSSRFCEPSQLHSQLSSWLPLDHAELLLI